MPFLYRYARQDETRQKLYTHLYQGLSIWQKAIFCGNFPPQEINAVMGDILRDHPELCHFEGKWEYRENAALPRYVLPPEALRETQAAAQAAFAAMPAGFLPQQAYVWLLEQVSYDPAAPNSQNAYGALVQRRAVCKGIAKAYQMLMELGNIPCVLAEGTLDGVTKHVWNMVFWEEQWLHVDVTMGYPCFRHLTGARDAFGGLLRTTEEISRSHSIRHPEALPRNKIGGGTNDDRQMQKRTFL